MNDSLQTVAYIERGVELLIYTLSMAKKMLAVQWMLGNVCIAISVVMIFILPWILKERQALKGKNKSFPKHWHYWGSRTLQTVKRALVLHWYVWYAGILIIAVFAYNTIPHMIPVPPEASVTFNEISQ